MNDVVRFSIDAFFDFEPINLSNMKLTEIVDAIKEGFASLSKAPEAVEEAVVEATETEAQVEQEVVATETEEKFDMQEFVKAFAIEMGKQIENVKIELKKEIEALKPQEVEEQPTQLTKAKPEVDEVEPKGFKEKMLYKLKNR